MHYHEIAAPGVLNRWVRCFWFLQTEAEGLQPIVPDGRLEIVVHRATPFGEMLPDGSVRRQSDVVVSGQLTRPVMVGPTGPADVIGIRFRTAGAADLFRLPLDELTDQILPLNEVVPGLASKISAAAATEDPVKAITAVLFDRLAGIQRSVDSESMVRLARGEKVTLVASALGVSVRTLERRVRDEYGLSPKVLQRIMRFRTLYALLQANPGNGAQAAARAGYFDQTHANRDFRQFAGCSPRDHFAAGNELAQALLSGSY